MPIIAVANPTPASGKSTTVVALAARLSAFGAQVLLVDCDPEADLTAAVQRSRAPDLFAVLKRDLPLTDALAPAVFPRVDLVAASDDLYRLDMSRFREDTLRSLIDSVAGRHGYVLLDTPSALDPYTSMALMAAEIALVPVPCEVESLQELPAFMQELERVRAEANPRLQPLLLLTVYDGGRIARYVAGQIRAAYPGLVLDAVIPDDDLLAEVLDRPSILDRETRGPFALSQAAMEIASKIIPVAP